LSASASAWQLIPDHAGRAAAETDGFGGDDQGLQGERRVNGCVQECLEVSVGLWVIAQGADAIQAASVAAEDEECGRSRNPRHRGCALRGILNLDDGDPLKIRFSRG
jgi:hypothetical protein